MEQVPPVGGAGIVCDMCFGTRDGLWRLRRENHGAKASPCGGGRGSGPHRELDRQRKQPAWVKLYLKNEQTANERVCLVNHEGQSTCRKQCRPRQPGELVPSIARRVHNRPFLVFGRCSSALTLVVSARISPA